MDGISPTERGARLRAARGYSGLKQPALADRLGVSVTTLSRWERGEGGGPDDTTLKRAARECDVPTWFMEHGFDSEPEPEDPTLTERVEALESKFGTIESLLADLRRRP